MVQEKTKFVIVSVFKKINKKETKDLKVTDIEGRPRVFNAHNRSSLGGKPKQC